MLIILLCLLGNPKPSRAGDLRLGVALGIGGAGVAENVVVNSTSTNVSRSEGPGTFTVYLDYLLSDRLSAAFEHSRGFRLGPFSSGVSFTGIAGRWYFLRPAPSVARLSATGATLLVKEFSPFVGLGMGVATANVSRQQDQVPELSGSGVYFGYKIGADYSLAPGIGLRPEMDYAATLMSPDQVTELSFQCGLFFYL